MAGKLLVVGDAAVEVEMDILSVPDPGEAEAGEDCRFLPGGAGGNAALCASCYGAEVSLCSRVGKDGNGERLRRFFAERGVGTKALFFEGALPTGMLLFLNERASSSCRTVAFRGASLRLSSSDFDAALAADCYDLLYLSSELDPALAAYAAASAEDRGIPALLDASSPVLLAALYQKGLRVRVLYTHDRVAGPFCKMAVRDAASALKCCLSLGQRLRADFYVLRMKDRGLFLYDGRTYRIVMVSDAADREPRAHFTDIEPAVLAAEFLGTGDMESACTVAAAADRLARGGDHGRIPGREAVTAYLEAHGIPFIV